MQRQFQSISDKVDRMMRGQPGPSVSILPTTTAMLPQPGPSHRQQQQSEVQGGSTGTGVTLQRMQQDRMLQAQVYR